MLKEILDSRGVPQLKTREEMLDMLQKEEYGYMPPRPDKFSWSEKIDIENFCAGKATLKRVTLTSEIYGESFSFPIYAAVPKKEGKYPFFVYISFRNQETDRYMPVEEIIDNGFAVLSFCYEDVSNDCNDFEDGLAGIITRKLGRGATTPGKLAMWAWAAQRVMDYAESIESLDLSLATVCGHSRLGKTALLCAATDERFFLGYSNNSGCSGAAIARGTKGETVKDICETRFPYWFCENYFKYIENEDKLPFDQHWLIASIAPRRAYVASAREDQWADPENEFLGCVGASPIYEQYGKEGFVTPEKFPEVGDVLHDGMIGYHLRAGTHYFGREDWQKVMAYIKRHI